MTPDFRRSLRWFGSAAGLAVLLLGGCERVTGALNLTGQVAPQAPQPVGPERLRVTLPARGASATLAPVARNGDVTVWQTRDGITLSFRDGLLIGTRGLGDDLMSADVEGTQAMLRAPATDLYHLHVRTYLGGEDQTLYRRYHCRETGRADKDLSVAGETRGTRRIEVSCTAPDGEMTNIYWLDPAGGIVRSRQWVSPAVGYMEAESANAQVAIRVE